MLAECLTRGSITVFHFGNPNLTATGRHHFCRLMQVNLASEAADSNVPFEMEKGETKLCVHMSYNRGKLLNFLI